MDSQVAQTHLALNAQRQKEWRKAQRASHVAAVAAKYSVDPVLLDMAYEAEYRRERKAESDKVFDEIMFDYLKSSIKKPKRKRGRHG